MLKPSTISRPALRLMLALATGAAPLAAAAGPVSPAPAASAPLAGVVVDAGGTVMGPFYPSPAVLVSLAGRPVLLPLRGGTTRAAPDSMDPASNGGEVFFESSDCSGQGWLQTSLTAGVAAVAVLPVSSRDVAVYIPDTAPPQNVTAASALVDRGARKAAACKVGKTVGKMRMAVQVIDISTVYVAPYHLQ